MNKIRPEMANHPLAVAAREVNDRAEKEGLNATCAHYNLKPEDLAYVAEQRGLRAIMLQAKTPTVPTPIKLDMAQLKLLLIVSAAIMDALVIGWRAREVYNEQNNGNKAL